jgi:hypothetical protein
MNKVNTFPSVAIQALQAVIHELAEALTLKNEISVEN